MSTYTGRTLLKIIVLGDIGVGKTSLIHRYVKKKFKSQYKATIGADFLCKEIEIDGKLLTLQIWDTAGQERFHSLGPMFFRGAECCVIVFDVNVQKTFDSVITWRNQFISQGNFSDPSKFPFVVIGNKIDHDEGLIRVVSEEQAKEWCKSIESATGSIIRYLETSAKKNLNVETAFFNIAKAAISRERPSDTYFDDAQRSTSEIVEQPSEGAQGGCAC